MALTLHVSMLAPFPSAAFPASLLQSVPTGRLHHLADADGWADSLLLPQVLQAELPERVSRMRRQHKPLNPYIVLAVGPEGCVPQPCLLSCTHARQSICCTSLYARNQIWSF